MAASWLCPGCRTRMFSPSSADAFTLCPECEKDRKSLLEQAVRNVRKDPLASFLPVLLADASEFRDMALSTIGKIRSEFRRLEREHG